MPPRTARAASIRTARAANAVVRRAGANGRRGGCSVRRKGGVCAAAPLPLNAFRSAQSWLAARFRSSLIRRRFVASVAGGIVQRRCRGVKLLGSQLEEPDGVAAGLLGDLPGIFAPALGHAAGDPRQERRFGCAASGAWASLSGAARTARRSRSSADPRGCAPPAARGLDRAARRKSNR